MDLHDRSCGRASMVMNLALLAAKTAYVTIIMGAFFYSNKLGTIDYFIWLPPFNEYVSAIQKTVLHRSFAT